MKIYIAGPYSAKTTLECLENTIKIIDIGIQLLKLGHTPYIPHLTHFVDMRAKKLGIKIDWQEYIDWDVEWLKVCDAILYVAQSKGADIELQTAIDNGLIVYKSIKEIKGNKGE